MADRGFEISEDCAKEALKLYVPPFLKGRQQFPPSEEKDGRSIAAVRCLVVRAIRRIKVFRILSSTFPISMAHLLNDIWGVCSLLTAFLPPLTGGPSSVDSETEEDPLNSCDDNPGDFLLDSILLSHHLTYVTFNTVHG